MHSRKPQYLASTVARRAALSVAIALLAALQAACSGTAPSQPATASSVAPARPADALAMLETGLRPSLLQPGESLPAWSLRERMVHHKVPGVAVALLRNGEVVAARGYGVRSAGGNEPVDADTLFSVGSVSKVVTAGVALRLVADGRLDLDADVNRYLRSWKIPPAPQFGNPAVSLRMLLSHTAGLSARGFADFQPAEPLPTLLQIMDGLPPAKNPPIRIQRRPGELYEYAGGGTMVEQLLIEETTGQSLDAAARERVFAPLGMRRSSFATLPDKTRNVAKAHNDKGEPVALPRGWESFPEAAASGLWTSANDLGAFVAGLLKSYRSPDGLLPQPLALQMMTEVAPSVHGLGPRLEGAGSARVFHHGGDNDSYHARIEAYLESGDGFVILTNGDGGTGLRREIRNALVDALGHAGEPPLQLVTLDLSAAAYADYAGSYTLAADVPMEYREVLTELFNVDTLRISAAAGRFAFQRPKDDKPQPLAALATARFVDAERGFPLFEFHRDAYGKVRGMTVSWDRARAYYRRDAGS
jgi:CubicO group peptidase (beta-lactamase class C family)